MKYRALTAAAQLLALCCPAALFAQSNQQGAATFRSGVDLVLVPVVVRDRQGHAIGNLTKDDFHLFDKGKAQTISRFSVETNGGAETIAKAIPVGGERQSDAGTSAISAVLPDRFVAYVFDDLHVDFGDLVRVQKAAIRHLGTALRPADRAAIYTTSGQGNLDFTDDRAKLDEAVMKLRPRPMLAPRANDCPYMTYYLADQIINKRNQQVLQAAIQDTIVCASLQPQAVQQAQSMVQGAAFQMIPAGEQDARVTLGVIREIVRRVSVMPGQRTVVLASPGLLTITPDSLEQTTDILDRAARGGVVISALDARGLYTDSDSDASQRGAATPQMAILRSQYARESDRQQADVLGELADGTGGTFFENSNDLEAGFNRVAAAPEYIYLLGFSPEKLKMDGSFHKLKVMVPEEKGASIEARRGYYAPKHAVNAEETAKSEIHDAVFSNEEIHDIPVDLNTQFFKPDPADAKLTVSAHVNVQHLPYKKVDGRNCDDLTVVAAVFDRNGNYLSGATKTLEMRLKDETLQKLSSGITVRNSFDLKPGTYRVRLVVRDDRGQLMSEENGAVDIP